MLKHKFILFSFLMFVQTLYAADWQSLMYDQRVGLASNTVDAITQDEEGYLYFATNRGLSIFDGSSFYTYNYQNVEGFSNSLTSLIMLDASHLLIGSRDKGLFLLDKWSDEIKPLHFENVSLSNITAIHVTDQKELWIATLNEGLFYMESYSALLKSGEQNLQLTKISFPFPSIYNLTSVEGKLFVASHGNALFRITKTDNSFTIDKCPLSPQTTSLHSILPVAEDELWVGTNDGISIVIKEFEGIWKLKKRIPLFSSPIRSINRISDKIYASTEGGGLFQVDLFSHQVVAMQEIKAKNLISSFVGNDHSLWIGSWNEGLYRLIISDHSFQNITYAANNNRKNLIWGFLPADSVNSYLMTNGMGLCSYRKGSAQIQTVSDYYPHIFSVCKKTGFPQLYVGTWGDGLKLFDTMKKQYVSSVRFHELDGSRILCIDRGRPGQLLVGAYPLGAYVLDERTDKLTKLGLPASLGEMNIRRFIPADEPDTYWMATFNAGLFKIHLSAEGTLSSYKKMLSSEKNTLQIENMLCEGKRLWLCLSDGLAYIDLNGTASFKMHREPLLNGMYVKAISQIQEGRYWVATLSGLICLDIANHCIKRFFTDEALYGLAAEQKSASLLVGGSNHLMLCRTDELLKKSSEAKAVIRLLSVNGRLITPANPAGEGHTYVNKAINYADTLLLPTGNQTLNFTLSSLVFEPMIDHVFYYKMDGVDNSWNQVVGKSATAIYNSLPAGTYVLHVRVNDADNAEGEKKLVIIKSDYWWNLWWVRSFVLLLLCGTVLAFILYDSRRRMKRKVAKLKVEQEEELYQQRMRFFTNMSHDLKTPLTLLLTPLQDMLENPHMPDLFKERLASMILNGEQLLARINKILNYRNAPFSEVSLHYEVYTVRQLLYEIVTPFKEYAERQGLVFNFYSEGLEEHPYTIYMDYAKIGSILENLISNAIKYTPEQGKVDVVYTIDSEILVIKITDTGMGIQPEQQAHIYDRYFRITDDNRGTGIGLYVVKHYVELLGGHIDVRSEVDKGTSFVVSLPLKASAAISEIQEGMKENDTTVARSEEGATIVIVDDNKEMREYLVEVFRSSYRVLSAANGRLALDLIQDEVPDLVISDLMMPDIDGLELCKTLKSNMTTSHIPFVMLSAKTSEEARMECWEVGVDLFETKPFNRKLLFTKVTNLLKNRRLIKYKYQLQNHSLSAVSEAASNEESLEDKFMRQVNEAIEKCGDMPDLSVEHLAKELSMKHDQLYRKLKALTGVSANQYIRSYRLNRAAALLRSKKYMVTEVLYRVGFSNPSYFTKCFKKEFGVSPSEYLLNMDNENEKTKECQ